MLFSRWTYSKLKSRHQWHRLGSCMTGWRDYCDSTHIYESDNFCDHRGMQLVFLGTSSSIPTLTRNTSSLALRLDRTIYLFDCGEGVQKQLNVTPFRPIAIDKIFISHMHGDHVFGLPGLLSGLGFTGSKAEPIHIYGPQGLRTWIRSTLKSSYGRVQTRYAVHEMIYKTEQNDSMMSTRMGDKHEDELMGEDIHRSGDGLWHLLNDGKYMVKAGLLQHTIPCWGFVLEESPRLGRFIVDCAIEAGIQPGSRNAALLQQGHSVTLESGREVFSHDVLGHPRRGRKIVILGDTFNSNSLLDSAQGADILVHECTILEEEAASAFARSHSTATMAGRFAKAIKARCLLLTHFSGKYERRPDRVEASVKAAQKAFGQKKVLAARDLLAVTVCATDEHT